MDVSSLVEMKRNPKIPELTPGDTVKVSARIVEGGKERIQVFQGVVIKIKRGGASASFTVRHVASGIGVERTFPLYSPLVEKVDIVRRGKVRRAKLYYLRGLSGKEARRKIKRVERQAKKISEELLVAEPEKEIEPVMEAVPEAVEEAAEAPAAEETKEPEAVAEEAPAAEKAPEAEAPAEPEAAAEAPAVEDVKEEAAAEEPKADAPVMEQTEEPAPAAEQAEGEEPEKETD